MAKREECDNKPTPEKRKDFLAFLSEYGNVTRAAEDADIGRVALYSYRERNKTFAAAWDKAAKIGAARLEDEARRRAVEGWDEPVFHRGCAVGAVRKYSDTLLICLLKAHYPDRYAERKKLDGNLTMTLADALDELDKTEPEGAA